MKLKNILAVIILSQYSFPIYSQIAITEVYYDTPYSEKYYGQSTNGAHHLGEYIELYNYTTEDITMNNWTLTDVASKYTFPQDIVIPSESFIIIAYRDLYIAPQTGNYFPTFFPNTVGQEAKIKYQGDMMWRNKMETITLRMGMIRQTNMNQYPIQQVHWYNSATVTNQDPNFLNPSNVNFYLPSLHLTSSGDYVVGNATPLSAQYVPPTQNLEDIPDYIDAINDVYSNLTWEEYSMALLQATCNLVIPTINQSPSQVSSNLKKCFNYDLSGNYEFAITCEEDQSRTAQSETVVEQPENEEYSSEELESINSKILLYPNPTSDIANISWDESVVGTISEIRVFNTSGVHIVTKNITSSQLSVIIDLSGQPTGFYLVDFILDTEQQISRNIIKL